MNSEEFNNPKEVEKWSSEDVRIATKNLLQDKTCDNCKHSFYCSLAHCKYNTCYKYEEHGIFRVVRTSFPTTIKDKIISVQPMQAPQETIFYLKPVKNTLFRRIIYEIRSIFNKKEW